MEKQILKDGIHLKVLIPQDLPFINVNRQKIQQVFVNILSNARYALNNKHPGHHAKKILEIRSKLVKRGKNDFVSTTIYDEGIGIDNRIMDRICDPFYSTKPKGEGG